MKQKIIKILFVSIIVFLLFLLPAKKSLGVDIPSNDKPTTQQTFSVEQLNNIKDEVEKLRNENYQSVLQSSQNTINKINQYTDSLTLVATIFGVAIGVSTAILGMHFYFTKKDFTDRLKEIKTYVKVAKASVSLAKENAKSVEEIVKKAKKESNKISKLREELENKIEIFNKVEKSKKSIKEKKAEIEELKQEIKDIIQNYNQSVGNLQTLNSQATVLSGSANLQYPYNINPAAGVVSPSGFIDQYTTIPETFGIEKCSKCGKPLSLDELYLDSQEPGVAISPERLCSDCIRKLKNNKK